MYLEAGESRPSEKCQHSVNEEEDSERWVTNVLPVKGVLTFSQEQWVAGRVLNIHACSSTFLFRPKTLMAMRENQILFDKYLSSQALATAMPL